MNTAITPTPTYVHRLAQRLRQHPLMRQAGPVPTDIEFVLSLALVHIRQDLAQGEFVDLPFLGEFKCVDARGAMIRYVASTDLLDTCQRQLDARLCAAQPAPPRLPQEIPIEEWPLAEDHRFRSDQS